MLQKGFLSPQTKNENSPKKATSRWVMIAGIIVTLSALIYMMNNFETALQNINVWLFVIIVGFGLMLISLWMNFFAKTKSRK